MVKSEPSVQSKKIKNITFLIPTSERDPFDNNIKY